MGAWRIDDNCTWCEIGTYKNVTGDMECSACPVDQTTLEVGSIDCGMLFTFLNKRDRWWIFSIKRA